LIKSTHSKLRIEKREIDSKFDDLGDELPEFLREIYLGRGISRKKELDHSLARLPLLDGFKGLEESVRLLEEALKNQENILIVGDYDADGATSTALAMLSLGAMGFKHVGFIVPDRFKYGYGLTPKIVELAKLRKPDLIVTVDNGISSIEGVIAAQDAGIKVLITDHHLPGLELPLADAVLNPNQHGCSFPCKNLAGVGVVFYLLSALRTRLRDTGWFAINDIDIPNMADWLDLVALGTVADVVPLDHTNRILVHQGLLRIRSGKLRPGLKALLDLADKDLKKLVASDLGFSAGPRLNAAGRMDDMSIGIACLIENEPGAAREYALQLDQLNCQRRAVETDMQKEGLAILGRLQMDQKSLPWGLCLFDKDWHIGVVGLLASRIKDKIHRPVIVFADAGNEYKGSARSIPGLHIRDALEVIATANPKLISKFGGHAMAAGLSIKASDYVAFSIAFDEEVKRQLTPFDLENKVLIDGELTSEELSLKNGLLLRDSGPWGQQFSEPLFKGRFFLISQHIVGKNHLKLKLSVDGKQDKQLDAIAFNVDLNVWPDYKNKQVEVVYKLNINSWQGSESLQLMIEHFA
jgi:single-stranded-DNA-specific exonuclease